MSTRQFSLRSRIHSTVLPPTDLDQISWHPGLLTLVP